jgi:hypothetical protein
VASSPEAAFAENDRRRSGWRWLLHVGLIGAGGLIGAVALAAAILTVLSAIAANFMIWLLVIPWVVGGWEVWAATIAVFLALGLAIAYGAYLLARLLVGIFWRRFKEARDGAQV